VALRELLFDVQSAADQPSSVEKETFPAPDLKTSSCVAGDQQL
jgi:hypothetical protein